MDILLILRVLVLLGVIFMGIRLGGMAIGYTGGIGVILLSLFLGMTPGGVPWDVILIIMSVIAAIAAMQIAGGLDYMVRVAEKILRNNPKQINFLAPTVTYFLTFLAGTGHTAFAMIPVIAEVAKEQDIKPATPLAIAVVSSQIAITASPVSAAVVFLTGVLEPLGWSYPTLLLVWLVTTFGGCMITAAIASMFFTQKLSDDPIYQDRLAKGLVGQSHAKSNEPLLPYAKRSVIIFLTGVILVVLYATAISDVIRVPFINYLSNIAANDPNSFANSIKSYLDPVPLPRDGAIMSFMLGIATSIVVFCKISTDKLADTPTFKSGMTACVCVLGVAWLGNTFVAGYTQQINELSKSLIEISPVFLAVALFFAAMLLYSQAATAKALIPVVILALNITPENAGQSYIIVASFAAVSALFVLPTYPTLLGAVQMDDTGSTRIGKYVFNHSFLVPGVLAIFFSVALGFIVAPLFG